MRLDARRGHRNWFVWDVKRCRPVKYCVWCDDETAQWGGFVQPFVPDLGGALLLETHQEDRITIYPERRLVLFNEVDAPDQADSELAVHLPPGSLRVEMG